MSDQQEAASGQAPEPPASARHGRRLALVAAVALALAGVVAALLLTEGGESPNGAGERSIPELLDVISTGSNQDARIGAAEELAERLDPDAVRELAGLAAGNERRPRGSESSATA